MIPFFRKLRKQLANDNRPLKYLRYAIGEIVLVVVGILIALQINNWNAERQANIETEAKRQSNLKEIYEGLKTDLVSFDTILSQLERQKTASKYLLAILDTENRHVDDSILFMKNQGEVVNSVLVERYKNTWDNLNESGQLLSLKDDELNIRLLEYYRFFDSRIENFNQLPVEVRLAQRKFAGLCFEFDSLVQRRESNNAILPNPEWYGCFLALEGLKVNLIYILESCYYNINWFTQLKTQAQSIIEYMEQNLAQEINLNKNL
jgi:hypothetical protein